MLLYTLSAIVCFTRKLGNPTKGHCPLGFALLFQLFLTAQIMYFCLILEAIKHDLTFQRFTICFTSLLCSRFQLSPLQFVTSHAISVKRYTLELYNDYPYLALYKFFDFHSCLNVDI